jgi:hypothetical protein
MRDQIDHNFSQIDHNREYAAMSSGACLDLQSLTRQAIDLHARRIGAANAQDASRSLARTMREAPGTLRNALYGRMKRVDAALRDKLARAVVNGIQHEMGRLSHEMEIARLCGAGPDAGRIHALEAELAALKAALGGS